MRPLRGLQETRVAVVSPGSPENTWLGHWARTRLRMVSRRTARVKMAHSSILAWKIPWTEEPGGLQSMESQRVRDLVETGSEPKVMIILSLILVQWSSQGFSGDSGYTPVAVLLLLLIIGALESLQGRRDLT